VSEANGQRSGGVTHAHSHGLGRSHGLSGGRRDQRRRLVLTLAFTSAYMLAEVVGGLWTGSLALLADAGHMFADVGALALSLFALWLAEQQAPPDRTYGYYRIEILAALANGAALIAVAGGLFLEAVERLAEPPPVLGGPMMLVALGGLAVNGLGLAVLHAGREDSLNLRGAWLHVLSDALGSVGAIGAGALIWAFGWSWADPVASILIGVLVVRSAWALVREAVAVLMEGAPGHIDVDEVRNALRSSDGVDSVHDLHVWTITSGLVALSCHVCAHDDVPARELLAQLQGLLRARFGIDHVTIQIEPPDFEEPRGCV
jgi:cobalt-zinc-cadmium efflux system protein